jgi:ABC-type nitrate/sulfonate/bicarbonate transport system substrate-binding protein
LLNEFSLQNEPGSKVLCTGNDVGAPVPGGIMIRKDFADANLETVKKTLACWMRAIGWINNPDNYDAVLTNMAAFYKTFGVELSASALEQEIETRPLFDLEGQLEIMDRGNSGTSTLDVSSCCAWLIII